MATTRLELRDRSKGHLGAVLAALYTDATIDSWLDEGLRRCAPVLLDEVEATVADVADTDRSFSVPAGCVYVTRVYGASGLVPGWRQFNGKVLLEKAIGGTGPYTLNVEYLGAWDVMTAGDAGVCPMADHQTDVIVFYSVARAFRQLAASRSDYRKYATQIDNNVELEDIERLGDFWESEFEKARLECRSYRQILFEKERRGGGPQVVGNADVR